MTITGFTFVDGANNSNGSIDLGGAHGQVSFRFHHNHLKSNSGGVFLIAEGTWGLIDHALWDETGSTGMVPLIFGGDFASRGYQDWSDPTNFGSSQAVYVEDSTYNALHTGTEGFFDGYYGCKFVIRNTAISGTEVGGWHGTDSGNYRSCVLGEIYNNTITNSTGTLLGVMNTRGGTLLFFDNSVGGSTGYSAINLQYYRVSQPSDVGQWGMAGAGLNWTPQSASGTNFNASINTVNAADFAASHAYAAGATVGPLTNNASAYNFQNASNCTSGAYPSSWAQTVGGKTTDSGGCVWTNVGGKTGASPAGAGFCTANPDTQCSGDSTCAAASPGDTCSRYFDSNGGRYPFRDQPGRVHNQVLAPNYAWNNSGSGLPSPLFVTDSATSNIVQSGVDYYNDTQMPGYASFTYPHPVQEGAKPPAPPTNVTARVQ